MLQSFNLVIKLSTPIKFYDHEAQMLKPLGFVELNKEYGFAMEDEDGLEYSSTLDRTNQQREAYWTKMPQLYSELTFLERGNNGRIIT